MVHRSLLPPSERAGFRFNGACLVYYRSCEPWLNPSRAAQPDIVIVPLLLSHCYCPIPKCCLCPLSGLEVRVCSDLLRNKLIFQVIDCLAGEKRLNYFRLMFLGNLTVSVVLRGRQHPSWLTATLLVICWPGSLLPRFWKTESSQGNYSLRQPGQLMLRGHSARWLCIFGLFGAAVAGS